MVIDGFIEINLLNFIVAPCDVVSDDDDDDDVACLEL